MNKEHIIQAAQAYVKEKGMSNNDLARLSNINPAYISNMMRGLYFVTVKGQNSPIADKWFKQLAAAIGLKLQKEYWKTIITPQFEEITSYLEAAKENGTSGMLIGETGCGKTYAVNKFVNMHPMHTYRLTVSKLHTLPFILEQLLEKLGLHEKGRSANKLDRIITYLQRLKHEGENVIIILDEAENLRTPVFGMVKAMYDGIVNYCSIVLIGTSELTEKMERMKRKNRDGFPQFCRRFKAGTRQLEPINSRKSFEEFFTMSGISDVGLQKLLLLECENYGELHDYVEPAIKEAERLGEPLTEDLFRLIYKMPDYSKTPKKS